jgi:uncharacterized protein (DUF1810 family)
MNDKTGDLSRFVKAQEPVYGTVLQELRNGKKRTHWMWFIFPQLEGLGHSFMATHYGIKNIEHAAAYLRHPILGSRLKECTRTMNSFEGKSAHDILGGPDEMKFRSSMTLFKHAASSGGVFAAALEKYFDGEEDELTLAKLNSAQR